MGRQCPRLNDCPENEQMAEKRGFRVNCEMLRTIFQPRALSIRYTSKPERAGFVYLSYSPPLNFEMRSVYC